jgi:predicted membrane metal-binding protein
MKMKHHKPLRILFLTIHHISLAFVSFTASYLFTLQLFKITGTYSVFRLYFISLCLGFVFALVIWWFEHRKPLRNNLSLRDSTIRICNALDRLIIGDFEVFLEKVNNDFFPELAEHINKLAKDLRVREYKREESLVAKSQEIQSYLTSIKRYTDLLKNENSPKEECVHYLEISKSEAQKLWTIGEDLI